MILSAARRILFPALLLCALASLRESSFAAEPWATYRVTEQAVRGGSIKKIDLFGLTEEPVVPATPAPPLRHRMGRRAVGGS